MLEANLLVVDVEMAKPAEENIMHFSRNIWDANNEFNVYSETAVVGISHTAYCINMCCIFTTERIIFESFGGYLLVLLSRQALRNLCSSRFTEKYRGYSPNRM